MTCVGVYPKMSAYESLLTEFQVKDEEVCFIGDDLADAWMIMRHCGVSSSCR